MPSNVISHVHQILITADQGLPANLPEPVARNVASVVADYPSAAHTLWSSEELRDLLRANFGREVLEAYDLLQPFAYKTDLARQCLLHQFGGIFFDLGVRSLNPLRPPAGKGLASFRDLDLSAPSWTAVQNAVVWALPGRRECALAIEAIVANCQKRFYGANPLYPTGPVLFGRVVAAAMAEKGQSEEADDQWIGVARQLTPGAGEPNLCLIAPDGTLIAHRTKGEGGDMRSLGLAVNDYNTFWGLRRVYGESQSVWPVDGRMIRLSDNAEMGQGGAVLRSGARGILTFGPYVNLPAGRYRAMARFKRCARLPQMDMDVAFGGGMVLVRRQAAVDAAGGSLTAGISFTTDCDLREVEFRTHFDQPFEGVVSEICLESV